MDFLTEQEDIPEGLMEWPRVASTSLQLAGETQIYGRSSEKQAYPLSKMSKKRIRSVTQGGKELPFWKMGFAFHLVQQVGSHLECS